MKNSTILLILIATNLIGSQTFAQAIFPLDENGEIVYTEIVKVDSIKAKDLYVRAYTWFANSFVNAKNVIQLNDKEAGRILGKGNFDVLIGIKGPEF